MGANARVTFTGRAMTFLADLAENASACLDRAGIARQRIGGHRGGGHPAGDRNVGNPRLLGHDQQRGAEHRCR